MRIAALKIASGQVHEREHLRGYSLPELLFCMAIIAILAASAVPAGNALIKSTRQRVHTNAFRDAVQLARDIASTSHAEITLCPYAENNSCGDNWNQGWILIQHAAAGQAALNDKSILAHAVDNTSLSIHSNRRQFSFRHSTRNTNGRASFCSAGALSTTVVVSYTGKTRVESSKQAEICG